MKSNCTCILIFMGFLVLGLPFTSYSEPLIPGGLLAYPIPIIGPNLLTNPGFSEIDLLKGTPVDWRVTKAFSVGAEPDKPGNKLLVLQDAPATPYAESAVQEIFLTKGSYRFGGMVKTKLTSPRGKGVRFSLVGAGSTEILFEDNDWQKLVAEKIFIPKDGKYAFKVEPYAEPAGSAWFDDVFLMREEQPLDVFLMYPNYRGLLFDDQSQVVKVSVATEIPPEKKREEYEVVLTVQEQKSGKIVYSERKPADASAIYTVDCSRYETGNALNIHLKLMALPNQELVYEYPPYRIVKVPGEIRKEMAVSFDQYNRFNVNGMPTFLLGVYDAGMGYPANERGWQITFSENRRLFELPINLYLNYWYGQAPLKAMQTMMNVLQSKGIYYLQTANAFNASYDPDSFLIDKDENYRMQISKHKGLAGFYTVDEAVPSLAPVMFKQYWQLKKAKPDGITFAALLNPNGLRYWRDTVDVLSMDPYPLAGAEPAQGYNLSFVADWTRATKDAVMDSRPFMTVLQFFKHTSKGRWPTVSELRNMSYMAIVEGANGLMYWSLGAKALAYVCKDWCEERVMYFERLKSVLHELKGLESVLAGLDHPEMLKTDNGSVRTRVKMVNGKGYIIAYNYGRISAKATFTWRSPLQTVHVYNENRSLHPIQPMNSMFQDSFGPYEAHVYELIEKR